jgi:hypothetical protein
MEITRKVVTTFVLLTALLECTIVAERSLAAFWAWYAYSAPYEGGGHITVGLHAQMFFYVLSGVLVALALWATPEHPKWKRVTKCSIAIVASVVLWWTGILLSPLASLRH